MKNDSFLHFKLLTVSVVLWLVFTVLSCPSRVNAQCTPTSATICADGDDLSEIWINNVSIGSFAYCNINNPCTPVCFPVPVSILNPAGNFVAAKITNTQATETWGTYLLDVTCSGGLHSYITNADGNTTMYYDPAGTNPPPVDGGGLTWIDPAYSYGATWVPAVSVTAFVNGKLIINPLTGTYIPPTAANAQGSGPLGTEVTYYRQTFAVTVVYPPPHPVFTLSQTVQGATSGIVTNQTITYVLNICNTGNFSSGGITVTDQLDPLISFTGPYNGPNFTVNSNDAHKPIFNFPATLWAAGLCQSVTFTATDYYVDPVNDICHVAGNTPSILWTDNGAVTQAVAVGTPVTLVCPGTPTFTFTPTWSNTPTFTFTPTYTLTPTNTFTLTNTPTITFTPTLTNTPTITFTPTNTFTPTLTFTPTNTFTLTNTFTITNTPTYTNTFTITFTPTNTLTPTITFTPTPTIPNEDIFYADKNLFNPTADKSVSIYVAYSKFPGDYNLRIYNTAGEHIKTLDTQRLTGTFRNSYHWDGTNKNGDPCASGVYVLYLIEPFDRKVKRLLLIR